MDNISGCPPSNQFRTLTSLSVVCCLYAPSSCLAFSFLPPFFCRFLILCYFLCCDFCLTTKRAEYLSEEGENTLKRCCNSVQGKKALNECEMEMWFPTQPRWVVKAGKPAHTLSFSSWNPLKQLPRQLLVEQGYWHALLHVIGTHLPLWSLHR